MTNIVIGKDIQLKHLLRGNEVYQYIFDETITGSIVNGKEIPHIQPNKLVVYDTLSDIIPMPRHFTVSDEYNKMFDNLEVGKKYFIKSNTGARGADQVYIDTETPKDMEVWVRFAYNYPIDIIHHIPLHESVSIFDKEYLENHSIYRKNCIVVEDIGTNIEEFRVILFLDGKYVVEKRVGYHPKGEFTREHYCCIDDRINEIINVLYDGLIALDLPYASFDVYFKDGEWGIFEASCEFGTMYELSVIKEMQLSVSKCRGDWSLNKIGKLELETPNEFRQILPLRLKS